MTEYEKMMAGEYYNAMDDDLVHQRNRCKQILSQLNKLEPNRNEEKCMLLNQLLGDEKNVYIEPPFYCDYGRNISIGTGTYFNFCCTVLDCNKVDIGSNCLFGPSVQIYAATHPIDPQMRLDGKENSKPVKIGNNVWIGGGAIICPGVVIGDNCVIGAGSVVVDDIPANTVAVGNPAKVVKELTPPVSSNKKSRRRTKEEPVETVQEEKDDQNEISSPIIDMVIV